MRSRRALLTALGTGACAGLAGCAGQVRRTLTRDPPVDGPCADLGWTWPTAGGDVGRTGRTDTAPPDPDADVVDVFAGASHDGRPRHAAALPAIGEETAYVPTAGGITAIGLDATAHPEIWRHDLDDDVDAVPATACGHLLAPGLNQLTALDPASGEPRWRTDVGSHGQTAVAAVGETVYVAGVDPVAVDARTGRVRWRAEGGDTIAVGDGVYTTRNVNGTGGIFAHEFDGEERWHLALGKIVGSASVRDGTVWTADNEGTVYAIDAATGATQWSRSPAAVEKVHSGLAVRGDDVIVPAGIGALSAVLDAATGETRWSVQTGIVTGRPVVGDDWVAFGRTNHGVTVYDRETGEERATWSRDRHGLGTVAGLAAVENGLVVREGSTSGLSLIR